MNATDKYDQANTDPLLIGSWFMVTLINAISDLQTKWESGTFDLYFTSHMLVMTVHSAEKNHSIANIDCRLRTIWQTSESNLLERIAFSRYHLRKFNCFFLGKQARWFDFMIKKHSNENP